MLHHEVERGVVLSLIVALLLLMGVQPTTSAAQSIPPQENSFNCADNLVAYRDTGIIVDYLGTDKDGQCLVRYNWPDRSKASVSHYEWIWRPNSAYPDEGRQIHHDVLFKDIPGQSETMHTRGGHSSTFTIIDRTDYMLNDARYPCLHYTATDRGGSGSGYYEITNHFWVDPTNGIILRAVGPLNWTVVSLQPMNTHRPISELPHH